MDKDTEEAINPAQMTLFDLIEDETGVQLCEVCKQPCKTSVHPECLNHWWNLEEFVKSVKKV